jgi:ferric-dicitrate binding protein FerR (iron transport regulator)
MTDNFFDGEHPIAALDERFELLSAYLDGEVTPSERKQVESWLATDAAFEHQYRQMQQLHHSFPRLTVPSSQPSEALAKDVFAKIDRRDRRRQFKWFGGAIAAAFLAAIGGLSGGLFGNNGQLQFADKTNTPAPLMVALNDPLVSMPVKAETTIELPMSAPEVIVD